MLRQKTFDPLKFLERTLELRVYYSKSGTHIVLDGLAALPEDKQRQARQVVRLYPRILELQMDAPKRELRPSIRKLLAQGKVEIVNGRYRPPAQARARPADVTGSNWKASPDHEAVSGRGPDKKCFILGL